MNRTSTRAAFEHLATEIAKSRSMIRARHEMLELLKWIFRNGLITWDEYDEYARIGISIIEEVKDGSVQAL